MCQSCNKAIFSNDTTFNEAVFLSIILLNVVLLLFFLVKMCKLCSYAFSYSNYHIHQTYKIYALSLINIMAALLVRKTQEDLYNYNQQNDVKNDSKDPVLLGYYIINDIFGVVSIFTNNILLLFNAFNWLAIAKDCDFTVIDDSKVIHSEEQDDQSEDASFVRVNQKKERKNIYYAKVYCLYCFLPIMLVLSLFGTLNHREGDSWCIIINLAIIVPAATPLIVYCIAFGLYLKKFSDPQVSIKTKMGLVFLLVSIILRSIYYLTFVINKEAAQWSAFPNMLYIIVCSLAPMLVITLLSEVQLHKEQFNILRRSSGLIFKSTII